MVIYRVLFTPYFWEILETILIFTRDFSSRASTLPK